MYIHLTIHSTYSLREGLMTPAELVQVAHADRMPSLGLTDHSLLTGVIEFVIAWKQSGMQTVIGLEVDLPDGPANILATSIERWSKLCRLSSAIAHREVPKPHCPIELLASYSKDLIAFTRYPIELAERTSAWK